MSYSQVFLYIYVMNISDRLYLSVFHKLKQYKPKRAALWAHLYVSLFQIGLCLVLGVFFTKFAKQMKLNVLDDTSLWIVSIGVVGFILFKNWMSYNGKKRAVLLSKSIKRSKTHALMVLILIPLALFALAFILFKAA